MPPTAIHSASQRSIKNRWGPELYAVSTARHKKSMLGGFVPVVRSFIRLYSKFPNKAEGMSPTLAMLIIHLLDTKWDEKPPVIKTSVIASRMGLTAQQVKKHFQKLEAYGIKPKYDPKTRNYTFLMEEFFSKLANLALIQLEHGGDEDGESPSVPDDFL